MKSLKAISTNFKLEYFTNEKNIPNQELVKETIDYFETGPGARAFKALDFLNLLEKQYQFVVSNIEEWEPVIDHLVNLPLSDLEKHILFGFIIKWFGGYPLEAPLRIRNAQFYYIFKKKLLEMFLSYEGQTPEKEFCKVNFKQRKELMKLGIAITTGINNNVSITDIYNAMPDNKPVNQVYHSFEKLFEDAVNKGTIKNFENKLSFLINLSSHNYEFNNWLQEYKDWEYNNESQYQKHLTEETFLEFLIYQKEKEKKMFAEPEGVKSFFPLLFYALPEKNMTPSKEAINDPGKMQKVNELRQSVNDLSFRKELERKEPSEIKEYLDFHLRSYLRYEDNQNKWINHTKELMPLSFSPLQKDAFLTWIENIQLNKEKVTRGNDKNKKYGILKEIFINEAAYIECIDALRKVKDPVISPNNKYLLGVRQKGVFAAWYELIKQREKLHPGTISEVVTKLLNKEIEGLNLSSDGSTLRRTGTSSYKKYKVPFTKLIQ